MGQFRFKIDLVTEDGFLDRGTIKFDTKMYLAEAVEMLNEVNDILNNISEDFYSKSDDDFLIDRIELN